MLHGWGGSFAWAQNDKWAIGSLKSRLARWIVSPLWNCDTVIRAMGAGSRRYKEFFGGDGMVSMHAFRTAAAIALMLAFFLPFSSCSGVGTAKPGKPESETAPQIQIHRAYERINTDDPVTLLIPFFFLWPVAMICVRRRYKSASSKLLLPFAELALAIATGYTVSAMLIFESPRAGAYLAFLGAGIYGLTALTELSMRLRARFRDAGDL